MGTVIHVAGIEFRDVARALDCETFARREMEMRGGRAKCPFHGGEHFNLQFFKDGHCFCHVCHKSGDVIQLAAAVWNMGQLEAARLLNTDFCLGLEDSSGPTEAEREARAREWAAREAEKAEKRAAWCRAADELREAETALDRLTVADAERGETWDAIRRFARAQDTWESLQAAGRTARA